MVDSEETHVSHGGVVGEGEGERDEDLDQSSLPKSVKFTSPTQLPSFPSDDNENNSCAVSTDCLELSCSQWKKKEKR
jgi:hypothetical protein